jgi:hypothetical protein
VSNLSGYLERELPVMPFYDITIDTDLAIEMGRVRTF